MGIAGVIKINGTPCSFAINPWEKNIPLQGYPVFKYLFL